MATNYPDVVPGQPISFSAQRENDMRHLLNSMNGMSSGAISGGVGKQTRLKVYNSTNEILPAGAAVTFADGEIVDEAVPAKKYKSGAIAYGVLESSLEPDRFGTAVISGPVNVEIHGSSGDFAAPFSDGKTFTAGASGAQILSRYGNRAVILLGGSGVKDEYKGYFALKALDQTEDDIKNNQLRVNVYDNSNAALADQYSGYAIINDVQTIMPSVTLTVTRSNPYIVLRYDVETKKRDIITLKTPNEELPWKYDYIIGEVTFKFNEKPEVLQRHHTMLGNGVIQFWTATDICSWVYKDESK